MNEVLDIYHDLYSFRLQLDRMVKGGDDEDAPFYICQKAIYFIRKYRNSEEVTMKQMEIVLSLANKVIPFLVKHSKCVFLEELLATRACDLLRSAGINIILNTKFGRLDAIDQVYLLFLEYVCFQLKQDIEVKKVENSDLELFLLTTGNIRRVEQFYAKYIPMRQFMVDEFKRINPQIALTKQDEKDIVAGRGRMGLNIFPKNEESKKEIGRRKCVCKEVKHGLAIACKFGLYANLEVEIKPRNSFYMESQKITFATNNDNYLIASPDCNPLMNARYRDLINLWPKVKYHVGSIPMTEDKSHFDFPRSVDFCRAFDLDEDTFSPLPDAIL